MLLVKNATIFTMKSGKVLEHSDILSHDGKIIQIGHDLTADSAQVIDATGLYITPGLIDAHCHAGGGVTLSSDDVNEITDPITPQLNVINSIDISDPYFRSLHKAGVTSCCIVPGSSNVICGTGLVCKTAGKDSIYELVVLDPAVMKCALGRMPKRCYGKRGRAPVTRMGAAALLRDALRRAAEYMTQKAVARVDESRRPVFDAKCEALIPVLKREIPLKVHCQQFDMLTVINISQEFGCDYTIEHGWCCGLYADELIAGGGMLSFGPIAIPEGYGELSGGDVFQLKSLYQSDLNICLITDGPIYGPEALLFSAGEAVRSGLDHLQALAMITCNPARGLRVDDRLGSLEIGKDADMVVFEGVPALDAGARVRYTIIDGRVVYSDK